MREFGAAVVHLSPHALGEPEVSVDNEGGHRRDGPRARRTSAIERIAFLAGPHVAVRRARAARRATGAGWRSAGWRSTSGSSSATPFDREGGARGRRRAPRARDAPFTAICCANDLLALGALARLAELGVRVPDDVSVAGFDDIAVAADHRAELSTVRVPAARAGPARVRRGRGTLLAGAAAAGEVLADRGRPPRIDRHSRPHTRTPTGIRNGAA